MHSNSQHQHQISIIFFQSMCVLEWIEKISYDFKKSQQSSELYMCLGGSLEKRDEDDIKLNQIGKQFVI